MDKPRAFVDRICTYTEAGALTWSETSHTDVFQATIADYVVRFSRDEEDEHYVLALYDSENKLLDQFRDGDFDSGHRSNYLLKMRKAFEVARRTALGVEQALDKILGSLPVDEPPPSDAHIPF